VEPPKKIEEPPKQVEPPANLTEGIFDKPKKGIFDETDDDDDLWG